VALHTGALTNAEHPEVSLDASGHLRPPGPRRAGRTIRADRLASRLPGGPGSGRPQAPGRKGIAGYVTGERAG